ncbi:MAG TPA: hypothetical protein VIY86_01335, partial [Pirellulaceae bacterium]
QIARLLREIAVDIESNDVARVVRHISGTTPELVAQVQRLMPKYEFHVAKVKSNLEIEWNRPDQPTAVEARFNAVFRVSERRGQLRHLLSPWFFIVRFVREDGTWKAISYERRDPREGYQRKSSDEKGRGPGPAP